MTDTNEYIETEDEKEEGHVNTREQKFSVVKLSNYYPGYATSQG